MLPCIVCSSKYVVVSEKKLSYLSLLSIDLIYCVARRIFVAGSLYLRLHD